MILLLIIADDFTGALDTGVQFAAHGVSTRVIVDPEVDFFRLTMTVVFSDKTQKPATSRPGKPSIIVARLTRKAREAGIRYIYKKDRFRSQRKHRGRACSGSHCQRL